MDCRLSRAGVSQKAIDISRMLILDIAGLAVAARRTRITSGDHDRRRPTGVPRRRFGHAGGFDAFSAALINGTAAHGEDYDDTFEGGPIHSGAVIVPAVLGRLRARGARRRPAARRASSSASSFMCRLSLVAPKAIHTAGFHPTGRHRHGCRLPRGVSARAAASAKPDDLRQSASPAAWPPGSSNIWPRAPGPSACMRVTPPQSGIRAALMARGGFIGPRTVLEGPHGFFQRLRAVAARRISMSSSWTVSASDWLRWRRIAFKPYACGTMTQPFIDCAIAVRRSTRRQLPSKSSKIVLQRRRRDRASAVGTTCPSSTVHRRPMPRNSATPICMAFGFIEPQGGPGAVHRGRSVRTDRVRSKSGLEDQLPSSIPTTNIPRTSPAIFWRSLGRYPCTRSVQGLMQWRAHAPLDPCRGRGQVHRQRALRRLEPRGG